MHIGADLRLGLKKAKVLGITKLASCVCSVIATARPCVAGSNPETTGSHCLDYFGSTLAMIKYVQTCESYLNL